jgi:hypothetical protein
VRAVCTNAASLWKGFQTRFFRFYDTPNVSKPTRIRPLLPEVQQGISLSPPITKDGEMPWTSP